MASDFAVLLAEFPWFFPSVAFVFGTLIGSFLNVCIHRIPAGKSVVHPGSHCACGAPIRWHDNIPVLSWFILHGKARCCGRAYSFRYAFVELLTGGLFLACALAFPPAKAACGWLFASALVAASFIDLDHFEIPDVFSLGLGVVGVLLAFAVPALHGQSHEFFPIAALRSGTLALQGLLIGSALVLWVALLAEAVLKKEAMGFGDVKFVGAIGAFCGWQGAVTSLFGGAVIGTAWFAIALLWQKISGRKLKLKTPEPTETGAASTDLAMGAHVPFGPMLALGGLLHFLWLHRWVDAYFAELHALMFQR
jgi:leader peptidase (prepilin peptidase)/N-methyltransferase